MDKLVNIYYILSFYTLSKAEAWTENAGFGYEYLFSTDTKKWHDAKQYCISQNANLASVHSNSEHGWIKSTRSNNEYWIGFRNPNAKNGGSNDKWSWSDGSNKSITKWATRTIGSEPNDSGNVCAYYGNSKEEDWYDTKCTKKKRYICKRDKDDCEGNSCLSGGTCVDRISGFYCECLPGYTGTYCEEDIDECASNPCKNNATCIEGVANHTCNCSKGFGGYHCETDIDECKTEGICQNDGICNNTVGSYHCECAEGFNGSSCQIDIDECLSSPCQNGGQCIQGIAMFTCKCKPGFSGEICQAEDTESAAYIWMVVGGGSAALLLILLVILIFFIRRCRHRKESPKQEKGDVTELDNIDPISRSGMDRSDSQIVTTDNELYENSPVNSPKRFSYGGALYTAPSKWGETHEGDVQPQHHVTNNGESDSLYAKEQTVTKPRNPSGDSLYTNEQPVAKPRNPSNDSLYTKEQPVAKPRNPSGDSLYTNEQPVAKPRNPSNHSLYTKEQPVAKPRNPSNDSLYTKEQPVAKPGNPSNDSLYTKGQSVTKPGNPSEQESDATDDVMYINQCDVTAEGITYAQNDCYFQRASVDEMLQHKHQNSDVTGNDVVRENGEENLYTYADHKSTPNRI